MKKLVKASTILALLSPFIAMAQTTVVPPAGGTGDTTGSINWTPTSGGVSGFLSKLSGWLVVLVTIVIAIGLLTFLWGVVGYITAGADEEKRGQARNLMIYGIIGLFVMVAVWGLVYLVGSIIGVKPGGGVELPGVPGV
jgi:uncharacterized membrane protein